jgi:predicted Rossmann fold nucleotide-binding protein DprA/Smf involved in DNA uptake
MSRRSDSALASLALVSRVTPSDAKPLSATEFWKLIAAVDDPANLLGQSEQRLRDSVGDGLSARVAQLLDRATALAFALEQLEQSGIRSATPFDDEYPTRLRDRLGNAAPVVLHLAGDARLLNSAGVAIVGSRDVSRDAAEAAKEIAQNAAAAGSVVISGGARGTDRLAMGSALDANGTVVGILADALTRTANDPEVRRAIGEDRLCLATPYAPSAPFSVGNAMSRNKLIYALADVTVVVECEEESGGTWAGAVEALKHHYGRVAVWTGAGAAPANHALVAKGAESFSGEHIERGDNTSAPTDAQLHLNL